MPSSAKRSPITVDLDGLLRPRAAEHIELGVLKWRSARQMAVADVFLLSRCCGGRETATSVADRYLFAERESAGGLPLGCDQIGSRAKASRPLPSWSCRRMDNFDGPLCLIVGPEIYQLQIRNVGNRILQSQEVRPHARISQTTGETARKHQTKFAGIGR